VRDFKDDFNLLKLQLVEKILEYCNDTKFREKLSSTDFYYDFPGDRAYLFWKYENYLREQNGYSPMSEAEQEEMARKHYKPKDLYKTINSYLL